MGTSVFGLRTQQDIDCIFANTHRDHRSNSEGEKKVMYLNEQGGTTLGLIASLPKRLFEEKLAMAKRAEAKKKADTILKDIFNEFNLGKYFEGTNQWRSSLQDVECILGAILDDSEEGREKQEQIVNRIKASDIIFPSAILGPIKLTLDKVKRIEEGPRKGQIGVVMSTPKGYRANGFGDNQSEAEAKAEARLRILASEEFKAHEE